MNDFFERFLCQGAWKKKPKIELSQRMMLKSFPTIILDAITIWMAIIEYLFHL